MEVELYRLLCQQLAAYFGTRPFALQSVSFAGVLTEEMDVHATIKAYAHRFLETVYSLS